MKTDTGIRHVTKAGANIFLELGFPPAEAKALQKAAREEMESKRFIKEQLMDEIAAWIAQHGLTQAEAAGVFKVSRPRVSDLVNKKTAKFTIDMLVEVLGRTGRRVTLTVGE